MPRKPRCYLSNVPCHVITRGNDRQACFFDTRDYQFYLEVLSDACERYKVALHAYVLMTNHVHLLMTPASEDGVSRVMQSVGRRYVQRINIKHRRTGTLWEGRHKASLVEDDAYLLACYRYIELNPVRASMVKHPIEYPWTSYFENSGAHELNIITPHSIYQRLGLTIKSQQVAYKALFKQQLQPSAINDIRTAATFSMPIGRGAFQCQIEKMVGRKLGYAKRGRPRYKQGSKQE